MSDEIGLKKAAEQLRRIYSTLADWRKRSSDVKKSNMTADTSELLTESEKQLDAMKMTKEELKNRSMDIHSVLRQNINLYFQRRWISTFQFTGKKLRWEN